MKFFTLALLVLVVFCAALAHAQDGINPRAVEDIKAFLKKVEEGDALFDQKKYAESASALAAAHELYLRADRRDSGAGSYTVSLKPNTFPALRHYGYGFGSVASLSETPSGAIQGTAAGLDAAVIHMWQDAGILGGADRFPVAGAFKDPSLVEMSEDELDRIVSTLYGPVSTIKLPVADDEWRDVVFWSRRARLIVEFALQKFPEWKTGKRGWSRDNDKLQMTGGEALADIEAKLAEAEPEYEKLVADFKKAAPRRAKEYMAEVMDSLNKAIEGVRQDGWLDWVLARDLYISKDYLADRRKNFIPLYVEEGKTMPEEIMKAIEDKVAELKGGIDQRAPRWTFPSGKPHNAAIEARASAGVMAKFPGATILKTALDGLEWSIAKNDLGIPRYRTRHVLVLVQIPGQKLPWLIMGNFDQTYTGGGTYDIVGKFAPPYSWIRIQAAK